MARERRRFSRVAQPFEVRHRIAGDLGAYWHAATIINLGAGGMRIRSAEPISPDVALDIEIQLPSNREPLALQGRAIWNQLQAAEVVEHGIEFMETKPAQQTQIDALVQFLRKSVLGTAQPS